MSEALSENTVDPTFEPDAVVVGAGLAVRLQRVLGVLVAAGRLGYPPRREAGRREDLLKTLLHE